MQRVTWWAYPGVTTPRLDDEWDDSVPVLADGSVGANETDVELTDNELQRERRLRRDALKRKRPPGFAPWPT
jgi:hypothetical protein